MTTTAHPPVPVVRTVQEKTKLWHAIVRRREIYVAVHPGSPRGWNVIVDTMSLPRGLRLTDRICDDINGFVDVLYDNKETNPTSTISGNEGCSTVIGPMKTVERALEVAQAASAALRDDYSLIGDLREALGVPRI